MRPKHFRHVPNRTSTSAGVGTSASSHEPRRSPLAETSCGRQTEAFRAPCKLSGERGRAGEASPCKEYSTRGSRRRRPLERLRTSPQPSAKDHILEVLGKVWGDTNFGAVLGCTEASEPLVSDLMEAPTGRVPKMLPDRTLSSEGRPIHDMRLHNAGGSKFDHPPALQPRHHQMARLSLWWSARHPKVPQVCAERDVSRAFKWHHIREEDTPEFGTSFPGEAIGVDGKLLIIYGVMVFGWSGSPGEYMVYAWAAKRHHEAHRPSDPEMNDIVNFMSKWLMDDGVVLEVLVGNRPWLSAAQLERSMHQVWGPEAINASKRDEEGSSFGGFT